MTPKVLAFAGSLRKDSYNKRLVKIAMRGAEKAGAEVTYLDLRDIPMPLFDEDDEEAHGLHPNARQFKDLLLSHQGILLACPEYNSSITGVLKNAIDWASRPVSGEKPLQCFDNKVVALMSASEGHLGGLRGLFTVRSILGNIRCIVLPDQMAISHADKVFGVDGGLVDPKQQAAIEALGVRVTAVVAKLND